MLLKSPESFPPPALLAHASSPSVDFRSNVEKSPGNHEALPQLWKKSGSLILTVLLRTKFECSVHPDYKQVMQQFSCCGSETKYSSE